MSDERTRDNLSESLPSTRSGGWGDRAPGTVSSPGSGGGQPGAGLREAAVRDAGAAVGTERGFASGVETASPASAPLSASSPPTLGANDREDAGADSPRGLDREDSLDHEFPVVDPDDGSARPNLTGPRRSRGRGRRLVNPAEKAAPLKPEQRLLLLDTWQRSGLPAGDFAALVGISKHTLYAWKKKFTESGPSGLMDQPKGGPWGSRLPELTKRTILMLKQANPEWGCQRISDLLLRGPALPASPSAVARVLHEAGYQMEEVATRPHPDQVRHFERAKPNQLWQTDLFTFILKRQNRRVYLVAFLDDHSRFIVGYGLHASQSSALVLEVLRASLTGYGVPQEILTDNGSQYVTWRGKSAFTRELEKQGIKQVVAAPRRPQTLGKIERFWGTLWRECVESAVFVDLGDARQRIGHFIDHYNFQRPHQGIDGLVPADRFFGAAPAVLRTLQARVQANALALARQGLPKAPFYLTGQAGGQPFSVHAEGERVILTRADGRQEIDLTPAPASGSEKSVSSLPEPICPQGTVTSAGAGFEEPPEPGASPLDEGRQRLREELLAPEGGQE
jgi:transposase InsO family protein